VNTRPIGPIVDQPHEARPPERVVMAGRHVRLEPIDPEIHAESLYAASHTGPDDDWLWDYLPHGPFADLADFTGWLEWCSGSADPLCFAVVDLRDGRACGMTSYLNIVPADARIEVGQIWYAPPIQKTALPTEAMFLMFSRVFDELGYRRLEWKCNDLNEPSKRAARRLGFTYEGTFRQHMIVKGRNRDTAWFSLLDSAWPAVRANMERWLAPENFDAEGRQRTSLSAMNEGIRDA
jgi:RimJ/RimL family protein N-acetyltransferase